VGQPVRSSLPRLQPVPGSGQERKKAPAERSALREYGEALIIALGLALVIRTFFIQAYKIPSGSMEPTLLIGDHILVNKLIYGLRMPDSILGLHPPGIPYGHYLFRLESVHHGDVVVFVFPPDPTKDFIKRVIGLAGDTIEVRGGVVYLNGAQVPDPHAHYEVPLAEHVTPSPRDNFGPVKVPDGKLFMMGDNRDRSYDSRWWGFVDDNEVEGRALIIYWSWDGEASGLFNVRWNRFGRLVE
jgi:signal peptidase I